ncbi:type II toxin-antitoxin system PemK/MazF family toxin [Alkalinema sp. FACHB-956]|uniref:type II toxin-antitoxin system PemK/MazF family toxin n=1 Tax=Alkalinema sp. FACHB-956 TaxID=2692768 RepID=UPI00168371EA|nr:type II toxin-antitoxin system PemK/MazF family toxin [Alkalinema sp. FACHB-956]MBD2329950.1 type II toxin-antitoxin system PemK/MazF family toxin [Alkalinema sp. FACHB-956]
MLRQGELVLIPVPFTDLSSQKRRPVIIISSTQYNRHSRDALVVAVTSNPDLVPFSFTIDNPDLESGNLKKPSVIRADKIYALDQTLIIKRFGVVNQVVIDRIFILIQEIILGT